MTTRTRNDIADLFRTYRRIAQDHTRKAARQTGWQAEQSHAMAERYRTLLTGAREMLDTIKDANL